MSGEVNVLGVVQMTDKEFWLHLADICAKPNLPDYKGRVGFGKFYGSYSAYYGLCSIFSDMHSDGLISYEQSRRMQKALNALPRIPGSGYVWPMTFEGAKQREQFCREQAEKCEKERD